MVKTERRKHKRVEVSVLMDLFTAGRFSSLGRGCITNLSLGGMCIETPADFEPALVLDLRFPLAEDFFLDVLGEVVWKKAHHSVFAYGIKFTNMGFGMKRKLNKYIRVRLAESASEGLEPRSY